MCGISPQPSTSTFACKCQKKCIIRNQGLITQLPCFLMPPFKTLKQQLPRREVATVLRHLSFKHVSTHLHIPPIGSYSFLSLICTRNDRSLHPSRAEVRTAQFRHQPPSPCRKATHLNFHQFTTHKLDTRVRFT